MAARNYARFLPAAVGSVFAQTVGDWELVIIDDGSTDDTPAAVRPFLADGRVRYVRSDRLGQSRAKNLGVGLSRGGFVAFLDADDAWLPAKLENQLAVFAAHPDVGVVYCLRSLIDETGNRVVVGSPDPTTGADRRSQAVRRGDLRSGPVARSGDRATTRSPVNTMTPADSPAGSRRAAREIDPFYVQNPVCFSSCVVRREVFDRVGGFDPGLDLAIDYDLWLRVARVTGFRCIPEELVQYRTGHGNLSKKLADRVATAFSIMHRSERRGGVSAAAVARGRADTCRTLGYVQRGAEPAEAVRWYLRALAQPHRRHETLKGLAAAAVKWAFGRRTAGAAENRAENR